MMKFFRFTKPYTLLFLGYLILSLCLFLYSYTQVDLNLTLSRASVAQSIQKAFQYIGYYNRPLSTLIYIGILSGFFVLYSVAISAARNGKLTHAQVWKIIGIVTIFLVGSYPAAFSYDFFNYMFTAKTVLVYHKNPYTVIPLQFAGIDPWTNFMRWTHLSSAYTPLWIAMTLVPYLAGLGYFLLILFGIKFLVAGFFLLACFALHRIMKEIDPKQAVVALVIFAFNPLVIIETLVSGHNDIAMMAFVLVALWFLYQKKKVAAWGYLALSIATKLMTIMLIPVFFLKKNRVLMLIAMLVGLVLVIIKRGEILPWYWVWIMPFIALLPERKHLLFLSSVFSFGLLLTNAPYLYVGSYDPWVVTLNAWLPYGILVVGGVILGIGQMVGPTKVRH